MSIEAMKQWLEALEGLINKTSGQAIYSFIETERRVAMSACVDLRQAIAEAEKRERNFCERCGKRLGKNDWDVHTCTPPASEKQEPDDLTIAYMSGVYDGKKQAIAEAENKEAAPVAKNEGGRITWLIEDWPQNCLLYTHTPPQRHELQAKGIHPAPCARHCEANAFQIVIRGLKAQRQWVGLTGDDWDEIFGNALTIGEAIKVTEAKLKEKNT